MDREYLSIDELSEYLGVDSKWIYTRTAPTGRERNKKEGIPILPRYRFGKYLRFRRAEVDEWAQQFRE